MNTHIKDLTGQRFGNLVVLRMLDERKNNLIMYECQCDCGNVVTVTGKYMKHSPAASCGCLAKAAVSKTRSIDITGQRFGRLTALRPTKQRANGHIVWECKCDCGNTVYVSKYRLTSGNKSSCGCLKKDPLFVSRTRDLTGQRFGRLVALRPLEERRNSYIVWECKCDCGNLAYVTSSNLKRGLTTSCGCFNKELISKKLMKDITGQRFDNLMAIAPTEKRKSGSVVWQCRCDCGKVTEASYFDLKRGYVISCGCMEEEG